MISHWAHLKSRAVAMRKRGASIRDIEKQLSIPRSTLSGWFKNIKLSDHHHSRLQKKWRSGLVTARKKAVAWHNTQKEARVALAQKDAENTLKSPSMTRKEVLELALAMLYLGEGSKREKGLVLGNSDVQLLRFFVNALKTLYNVDLNKIRCELHLRADQNASQLVKYWSRNLQIPKERFGGIYFDKRTTGHKTYISYHGVCVVSYHNIAIQRKLMYLYTLYCQEVIHLGTRSSVGRARL